MKFGRSLLGLIHCRNGNVALMSALAMPVLVGGAAFSVDSAYWYFRDMELQAAADAGAYAAGLEMRAGVSESDVTAAALREAGENGFDVAKGVMVVNTPPTEGGYRRPQAVEVVLTESQERFFSGLYGRSAVQAKARAVAIYDTASNACVIALDSTAPASVSMRGSASLTLQGCVVMANSMAENAVDLGGSSRLVADCLISAGGISAGSSVTLTECSRAVTHAPPVADPFRLAPQPVPSGACLSDSGAVLRPGRYCHGFTLRGEVKLEPGVYYVEGGDFRANSGAKITGEGVTIFLGNGVGTRFNGTATINLSAPTAGTYSGLLFFADRAGARQSHLFNGGAASSLTGAIYMAGQDVEYAGNFTGDDGCMQIVARTINWSGRGQIAADCTARGMSALPAQQLVRIVE